MAVLQLAPLRLAFAARHRDRPGGEGLAARLGSWML